MNFFARLVCGFALCLCASPAGAGFELTFDTDSLRFSGNTYAIDVVLHQTAGPTPSTIHDILMSVKFEPAVSGINFVALTQPLSQPLFANPEFNFGGPGNTDWFARVGALGADAAASDGKRAFALQFTVDPDVSRAVDILFDTPSTNFRPTNNEGIMPFDGLGRASLVVGVPEPASCAMTAIALGAVACFRRRRVRVDASQSA